MEIADLDMDEQAEEEEEEEEGGYAQQRMERGPTFVSAKIGR